MEIIDEILCKDKFNDEYIKSIYDPNDILMFDIETTGLSPAKAFIYLIGLNYYKDGNWHITLLFNEDGNSEKELLETFAKILGDYPYLFSFNGDSFDIRFVKERMKQYAPADNLLARNLSKTVSVDLMKLIKPYKSCFNLPNIKQKTIETFLGIHRIDQYNGGQMIEVYLNYLHNHNPKYRELFIQHNRDDMEGMYHLSQLLYIKYLGKGECNDVNISIKENAGRLFLKLSSDMQICAPREMYFYFDDYSLHAESNGLTLTVPILTGTLGYYVMGNKIATHEKTGYFIKQPAGHYILTPYKESMKSKCSYIEINDAFLGNQDLLREYLKLKLNELP